MSVIVVGSIAYDSVRTNAGQRKRMLGGSVTHFANAASLLSKAQLVGVVGKDFKKEDMAFLERKSIATDGIEVLKDEKTFFWKGHYSENFDEAITEETQLNALAKFSPVIPQSYKRGDYILFLANMQPDIQKACALQCSDSRLIVIDTMNYWIENRLDTLKDAMESVDGLILNEGEAELLSGEKDLKKAAQALFRPHFKILIIKKGSHGVMIFTPQYIVTLPAFPVSKITDPTGAGDSFGGAFFSYIDAHRLYDLNRDGVKKAAAYATIVASFAVEGFGVEGIEGKSHDDVYARLEEFREMMCF